MLKLFIRVINSVILDRKGILSFLLATDFAENPSLAPKYFPLKEEWTHRNGKFSV